MFPFKDKRKDKSEMAGVVHKAKGRWVGHPHVGPLWTASYKQVISVPKDSRWCQRSLPGPAVLWQSGARHWEGTEWPDWGKQTSSKLSSYSDLRMREIRGQCTLDNPRALALCWSVSHSPLCSRSLGNQKERSTTIPHGECTPCWALYAIEGQCMSHGSDEWTREDRKTGEWGLRWCRISPGVNQASEHLAASFLNHKLWPLTRLWNLF